MKVFKFDFEMTLNNGKTIATEYLFAEDEERAREIAWRLISVWKRMSPKVALYGSVLNVEEANDVPFGSYIFGDNQTGQWYKHWVDGQGK